jgi:hypothetical protein
MEGEEQKENYAHEFDPEMALVAAEAQAEMEAEKQAAQEIEIIREEEIMISNEGEENEEKEEEGKTILRARKKKKNYVNYDANNYKNTNTNTNTKTTTTKTTTTNNNTNITLNKKKVVLKKDVMYDPDFDPNANYFYQNISDSDWDKIKSFLRKAFNGQIPTENHLKIFFDEFPKLKRGNIEKLQNALDTVASEKKNFRAYQTIMKFFLQEFYKPKPSICNVYFFPNSKNEKYLIEMLRTCMKSLNIAIFSITRDNFAKAIIEVFKRGVDVKVIADDECVKNYGSDVYKLAAAGIPCKTDSSAQFHMHNKYAIIDESVIITGSFNWTTQAINNNQENLFFYEDKEIAQQYVKEFNKLWSSFTAVIDKETALRQIELEKKQKTNTNNKK